MIRISNKKFKSVQIHELGYWKHTQYKPIGPWKHYARVFGKHLSGNLGCVVDVGCGPVPFFCSQRITYEKAYACDPLFGKYEKLKKYIGWRHDVFESCLSTRELASGIADTTFALNVIDHAQDPRELIDEIARITKGMLFLFVDIDKPKDKMHPHTILKKRLLKSLLQHFEPVLVHTQKSWKFKNDCLWYVGRRNDESSTHLKPKKK